MTKRMINRIIRNIIGLVFCCVFLVSSARDEAIGVVIPWALVTGAYITLLLEDIIEFIPILIDKYRQQK